MRVVPHLVIVAGVAALVVAAGVPLLVELRAARARRRATTCELDADERLPWAVRAVGMLREAVSQWLVLLAAPLTLGRRYARIVVNRADTPLVAVLGWGQHPVLWRTLLRRLRADGWGPIAVVGWTTPRLSLDVGVEALAAAVARLRAATGAARVDVVAHGAGGLVVRAYVRTHPADAGIRRVVTVGTPHQGTVVARWAGLGRFVGALDPNGRTMAALVDDDPVPECVDVTAVSSAEDALVLPPSNAYYPGAFCIGVRGPGHWGLLTSWRVYALLRENLATATATARVVASGTPPDG